MERDMGRSLQTNPQNKNKKKREKRGKNRTVPYQVPSARMGLVIDPPALAALLSGRLSPLDFALGMARSGVPVFPVHPIDAGPSAKAPATRGGFYDATTDEAEIEAWFVRRYGVAFAPASAGLVVVDIDIKAEADGMASWAAWCHDAGIDPADHPHRVETPSGGVHLYYAAPSGDPVAAANGLMPGIDVRGIGGYVLLHSGWGKRRYEIADERAWLEASSWLPLPVELPRASSDTGRVQVSQEAASAWLADLSSVVPASAGAQEAMRAEVDMALSDVREGERHEAGLRIVSELIHRAREGECRLDLAIDAARSCWMALGTSDEVQERSLEWDAIVLWGLSADWCRSSDDDIDKVRRGIPPDRSDKAAPVDPHAASRPALPVSEAGLAAALAHIGVELRRNVRTSKVEFRRRPEDAEDISGWDVLDDDHESYIRRQIAERCRARGDGRALRFTRSQWDEYVGALLSVNRQDPFDAWLRSLPAFDGQPRIDGLLESIFEPASAESALLMRWAGPYILLGAVRRTMHPGSKADELPILVGPQGCGKSTFLASLLPPAYRDLWFTDGLSFTLRQRERVELCMGKVLIELSELVGSTRAEIAQIKADLSRQVDTVRLSYRRNPQDIPRRFVTVGTANPGPILPNDRSGLRRFVPIDIASRRKSLPDVGALVAVIDGIRDQLWSEALSRVDAGEEIWLQGDLLPEVAAHAADSHRNADEELEDEVAGWLWRRFGETKGGGSRPMGGSLNLGEDARHRGEWFTVGEVADGISVANPLGLVAQSDIYRVRAALQYHGCEQMGNVRRPTDGRKSRWWSPPAVLVDPNGAGGIAAAGILFEAEAES